MKMKSFFTSSHITLQMELSLRHRHEKGKSSAGLNQYHSVENILADDPTVAALCEPKITSYAARLHNAAALSKFQEKLTYQMDG